MSKTLYKNVFCIEGYWTNNLKSRTSIKSALDFLESNSQIKYIHRSAATIDQVDYLMKESLLQSYKEYSIIYLASHGYPGEIKFGKRKIITMEEIAEMIEGKANDKIIHFGSCSTLNVPGKRIRRFLDKTGALAVSGYTREIDFVPSTFLDILYFQLCQEYRKIPLIHKDLKNYYGKVANKIGFKMIYEK
jgi:hypothetical protein